MEVLELKGSYIKIYLHLHNYYIINGNKNHDSFSLYFIPNGQFTSLCRKNKMKIFRSLDFHTIMYN